MLTGDRESFTMIDSCSSASVQSSQQAATAAGQICFDALSLSTL